MPGPRPFYLDSLAVTDAWVEVVVSPPIDVPDGQKPTVIESTRLLIDRDLVAEDLEAIMDLVEQMVGVAKVAQGGIPDERPARR